MNLPFKKKFAKFVKEFIVSALLAVLISFVTLSAWYLFDYGGVESENLIESLLEMLGMSALIAFVTVLPACICYHFFVIFICSKVKALWIFLVTFASVELCLIISSFFILKSSIQDKYVSLLFLDAFKVGLLVGLLTFIDLKYHFFAKAIRSIVYKSRGASRS